MAAWACSVCTFENVDTHLVCAVCLAPRAVVNEADLARLTDDDKQRSGQAKAKKKGWASSAGNASSATNNTLAAPAPPNSFAALASKSTNKSSAAAPAPAPAVTSPVVSTTKPRPAVLSTSGEPIELKDLAPEESFARPHAFHLVVKGFQGSLSSKDVAAQFGAEVFPFSVKRVVTMYYEEPHHKHGGRVKPPTEIRGPTNEPHVKARAFIEFYPAKGLNIALRKLIGYGEEVITKTDAVPEFPSWYKNCVIAPYFESPGQRFINGKELCPYVAKGCRRYRLGTCPYIHEPENWGIVRFDGLPSTDSASPRVASVKSAAAREERQGKKGAISAPASMEESDPVILENIRLMELAQQRKREEEAKKKAAATLSADGTQSKTKVDNAPIASVKVVCCNACGEDRPEPEFNSVNLKEPNYCSQCHKKGVPKVECARCLQRKYTSELVGPGTCRECLQEGTADDIPRINGPHHARADFANGVVLSRHEIVSLLGSNVGKVREIEFYTLEDGTPRGCRVAFETWNYLTMAPLVRALIPPRGVTLLVDDHPNQPRVEQLLSLVPNTLTFQEFTVLEAYYRGMPPVGARMS